MKNALVFVGGYSPQFLILQDIFRKKQPLELIFIETGKAISTDLISVDQYYHLNNDSENLTDLIKTLSTSYQYVYCLCVSYGIAQTINSISGITNIISLAPNNDCLKVLLNKKEMSKLAHKVGLPILESHFINKEVVDLPYPQVIRPVDESTGQFKAEVVQNDKQLEAYLGTEIIAQRYIKGHNLVVHVARSAQATRFETFITKLKFEGVTLVLEQVDKEQYSHLFPAIDRYLESIDFIGVGHFEFIVDCHNQDSFYFLEFNGRLGGTTLKTYALGYNEIGELLSLHQIIWNDTPLVRRSQTTNVHTIFKYMMKIISGRTSPIDYPQMGRLLGLFNAVKFLFTAKNELATVSLAIMIQYIICSIRGRFK